MRPAQGCNAGLALHKLLWHTIYHSEGQADRLRQLLETKGKKAMITTTIHRPTGISAAIRDVFSAISAKLAAIYGREGSAEPKAAAWHYYAA